MSKTNLYNILCLLLLILITSNAYSRKFYFSSSGGSDSYSVSQAQNPATPWKSLVNLHRFANGMSPFGAAPNRAAAGDTFLFKCGDVFSTGFNNSNDDFGVVKWWKGVAGYTAPTGTANAPIVFTSYGTGSKPNLLFPNPTAVVARNRYVLNFKNVGYLYFDNLQFNDTRFAVNDKVTSAYTCSGMMMGESNSSICNNIKVTNCNFSNTCYGIVSTARNFEISNNTFTNFKSCGDSIGINDIGADALQPSGYKYLIKNNLIQGSWAYANPNSSSQGKLGGGLETINDFDSSLIIYNTFLDNSGAMEFGQNNGTQYGPNDDTFAYNKFINSSVVSYVNVTGTFACTAARLHFWNNVIIENRNSRHNGSNFGQDVLNDGQSYTNWTYWPSYPLNPTINNPGGWRPFQYSSDAGVTADTLYDIRNNIFWNSNGLQIKYTGRTKIKYANNIYRLSGGASLGGTLGTGEFSTTSQLFADTSSANPMNWNFNLLPNSPGINGGVNLGLNYDFNLNPIAGNPDIGILEYTQVSPPTPPITPSLVGTANAVGILCNGGTTTVTIAATGGTSPYVGTGTFTVGAGIHNYVVTDAAGNRDSVSVNISQPSVISVSVSTGTIATFGGTTNVQVTANGGTGTAYQYSLNGGSYQTSNSFSGVPAGNHVVNVKDINGCIVVKNFSISAPVIAPLVATANATSISCNGNTTIVTVAASGGVAPYVGTGSFVTVAGTYSYTVSDANGSSTIASITISEPQAIIVNTVSGNILVNGGSTTVTVNASGGVSPFTYKLDNGNYQTANLFSGVIAGSHIATVKDANGCTKTNNFVITQPSVLNASAISGTIACNGGSTTVTVSATGGTAPYSGTGNFTAVAGTHNYTITDANGISQSVGVTITQPSLLSATLTAGTISVYGGTTSINVNASGGTPIFNYSLNSGTAQTSNVFSNVPAGNHNVLITDANGCNTTKSISITQPSNNPVIVSAVAGQITCFGGTTMVTVTATGGTAPYTGTGVFSAAAGTRTYTVRDALGATQSATIIITQPTDILLSVSVANDISVIGGTTSVSASATGGSGSFRYSLDGGQTQTSSTFRAVTAGTHSMMAIDLNGCSKMSTFTVNQASTAGMVLNLISKTDATCKGARNGFVEVKASGGREPYQYAIGNGNYQINNRFYGLKAGTYRVYAKDANRNVVSIVVVILDGRNNCQTGRIMINDTTVNKTVSINAYPNPSASSFKLAINTDSDEDVKIEVIDLSGNRIFTTKGSPVTIYSFGQQFKAGVYFVRVIQGEYQSTQKVIKL